MTETPKGTNAFWLGLGLLGIVGLFLGFSAAGAVRAVLLSKALPAAPSAGQSVVSGHAPMARVDKDAMIVAANPGDRDPFREPPAMRSEGASSARGAQQAVREVPICSGLLYDNVSPLVELATESGSSGWLRKGDQFLGWMIVQINPKSVTIAKGSESVVLHSP
jgi:hypothetical protein